MSDTRELFERYAVEWDRRVATGDLCWLAEDRKSPEIFHKSAIRDGEILFSGLDSSTSRRCTALEFGCGSGRLLKVASTRFQEVIGVDISAVALECAARYVADLPNVRLERVQHGEIPLPTSSIDLAYSFATFGHLSLPAAVSALFEISRVLRSSGVFQLQIYLGSAITSVIEDTFTIRSYREDNFAAAMELAGYSIRSTSDLLLPFDTVDRERDRKPVIVSLERTRDPEVTVEQVAGALCPEGEGSVGGSFDGSELEYRVVVTRVNELVHERRLGEAKRLLRYLVTSRKHVPSGVTEALCHLEEISEV